MTGRDVVIPAEGHGLPAYAAIPPNPRRGAVIIHEILGRQPEIDRVVDRFSRAGWAAVAPDLFARGKLCIWHMMRAVGTGQGTMVEETRSARSWLCREAKLDEGSIGLIGFCLAGGFVLAIGGGWGAVSSNYGGVPPLERMRDLGPTIACYGGRDRIFGGQSERFRAAARQLGIEAEVHVFPEVGHAFLTDGHHPLAEALTRPFFRIEYQPAIAEEAWRRIFAFFERHLTPADR